MKKHSKVKHILLSALAAIIAFIIVITVLGLAFFRFYIMPKYHIGEENQISNMELVSFAKYIADKQFMDNLKNFDKEAAKESLEIIKELQQESSLSEDALGVWDNTLTKPIKNASANTIDEETKKAVESHAENLDKKSAYARIMAAATAEEISVGLSIMSKVDMETISQLQKAGKKAELKAYLKSRLTPSEISTAISLYNKYKHLL